MRNIALGESLICIFQEFLDTINEKIIFAGRLGTLLSFYEPYTYSLYFLIAQNTQSQVIPQPLSQLIYTIFISNSCASCHLW